MKGNLLIFLFVWPLLAAEEDLDPNGYILYCPCMGRFGNQADHFLGALSFAHGFNRTLVLPPWVEYHPGNMRSVQVPFNTYFKVAPLREYHRVMTMEDFMDNLAPLIWPEGKRTVFCYGPRQGGKDKTCNAKEGNPFGPFWDTFNIDFDDSVFYGPLHYDTHEYRNYQNWMEKYPPSTHYILAFTGAPASFPVREPDAQLQKYLQWSDNINDKAVSFIEKHLPKRPLLGLHFRNGPDWERACEHVYPSQHRNMFGSAQCLGFNMEHGLLSKDLCLPPRDTVLSQILDIVEAKGIKSIFVASDHDFMIQEIEQMINNKIKVKSYSPSNPHVDLAILGKADYHIGNCVSTFSAFATRERKVNEKHVSFWAFESNNRDEL